MDAQVTLQVRVDDVPRHVDALLALQASNLRRLAREVSHALYDPEGHLDAEHARSRDPYPEEIKDAIAEISDIRLDLADVDHQLQQLSNVLSGVVSPEDTYRTSDSSEVSSSDTEQLVDTVKKMREQTEKLSGFNDFIRKINNGSIGPLTDSEELGGEGEGS
jgi:hypothetical protein